MNTLKMWCVKYTTDEIELTTIVKAKGEVGALGRGGIKINEALRKLSKTFVQIKRDDLTVEEMYTCSKCGEVTPSWHVGEYQSAICADCYIRELEIDLSNKE